MKFIQTPARGLGVHESWVEVPEIFWLLGLGVFFFFTWVYDPLKARLAASVWSHMCWQCMPLACAKSLDFFKKDVDGVRAPLYFGGLNGADFPVTPSLLVPHLTSLASQLTGVLFIRKADTIFFQKSHQ